ncbi:MULTISPECIES: metal-dependent hydrolase [Metallosphaera]|uniref:metal-dependent hydrolase n=1 Tax=Metallosphaera TaxID=41980 RepID=UPI001F07015E|nr:metal-dependent hydrolase [Metallosphaera sedula]MCH1771269.1 metal-dependent hydrolase [Metallosphaera sedula]MCP6729659.1 metal-dependent hydrolase [Metallosphaera sedula]
MNLNSHIAFALAVGLALFHNIPLAVLVGIGAALPDLDREYIFTRRKIFAKYQLHRALFHNVFVGLAVMYFDFYLGLGMFLHFGLDLLTSPTDRGIELFFPLGRLVKTFKLHYDGKVSREKGIMWYLEDPSTLVNRTADPGLREIERMPWIRVYGPFKNSRLVDWTIFYGSFIFIQLYEINNLLSWWENFLYTVFVKYLLIDVGIVIFYALGELWRRRLQFRQVSMVTKSVILGGMILGLVLILIQGATLYSPMTLNSRFLELGLLSLTLGLVLAIVHVRLRFKEIVM